MLDLCIPCKNKGRFRAPYKVIKGVPMCGGCVADYEANPPAEAAPQAVQFLETVKEEKGGTVMAKRIDEETRTAIRQDAAAGMNFNQISAKHSISWGAIRSIVGVNGKKAAGGGDATPPRAKRAKNGTRRVAAATANGVSRFADTIAQLREERERIDRVIADLEHIG